MTNKKKHPADRAARLKLKNEAKEKGKPVINGKRKLKEELKDRETKDELLRATVGDSLGTS